MILKLRKRCQKKVPEKLPVGNGSCKCRMPGELHFIPLTGYQKKQNGLLFWQKSWCRDFSSLEKSFTNPFEFFFNGFSSSLGHVALTNPHMEKAKESIFTLQSKKRLGLFEISNTASAQVSAHAIRSRR